VLDEWCKHDNIMDGPGPLANLTPSNPNVSLSWVVLVLVPGKQYPETGIRDIQYGKISVRICAPIQNIPSCFRALVAWDESLLKDSEY